MKDKDNSKGNKSYFAVSRSKKRQYILKIGVPVAAAAIVLGIVFATQASEHGIGAKMVMHIHPQLNVMVNGKAITVPEKIGIDNSLYKDHSLDRFGVQGISPLHTHDSKGTIHVESSVNRDYTLGEFLDVWGGLYTNGKTVKATVNGQPVSDWRNHILKDKEQISLEIS